MFFVAAIYCGPGTGSSCALAFGTSSRYTCLGGCFPLIGDFRVAHYDEKQKLRLPQPYSMLKLPCAFAPPTVRSW